MLVWLNCNTRIEELREKSMESKLSPETTFRNPAKKNTVKNDEKPIGQGLLYKVGPLPAINEVIAPIDKVIPSLPIYVRPFVGAPFISIYNDRFGAHLENFPSSVSHPYPWAQGLRYSKFRGSKGGLWKWEGKSGAGGGNGGWGVRFWRF